MFRTRALVLAATLAFAACGGGVFIGIDGDFDDSPPSVSLVASSALVVAGQPVRLVAAVADESGIDRVEFFRFDGSTPVRLADLGGPPWEVTTVVPADGRTELQVYARATDGAGNTANSSVVLVAVAP